MFVFAANWMLSLPLVFINQLYYSSQDTESHLCMPQGLTLKRHIDATLGQGNIREAVKLPAGEDLNEWLAVNTVDMYNAISVLHSTLEEFCTPSNCPSMTAGARVNYPLSLSLLAEKGQQHN